MQPHLCTRDHEGISHVVARVSEIRKAQPLERALLFLDGQKVRQHLRRMELVGQAVPDGHARVFCQFLYDLLAEAAVFDAVIHPPEDLGRVGDGLLLSHLAAAGVEIRHAHTKVHSGDLK